MARMLNEHRSSEAVLGRDEAVQETLASFVPATLIRLAAARNGPLTEPELYVFDAAIVIVDVTGFSDMADRLAMGAGEGLDRLSSMLSGNFAALIARIEQHGGDVLTFAGDALVAAWPMERPNAEAGMRKALRAASGFQKELVAVAGAAESPVIVRTGVAAGSLYLLLLGGQDDRWHVVVSGDGVQRAAAAAARAAPGRVEIDGSVAPYATPTIHEEREAEAAGSWASVRPTGASLAAMRQLVPDVVASQAEIRSERWLAEIRTVTVLFVALPEVVNDPDHARDFAELFAEIQRAVARRDGVINNMTRDEKGTFAVIVFGLPPHGHADDATRGLETAVGIQALLERRGLAVHIGVSTGTTFCGPLGSAARRIYAVMGRTVNLAARLMAAGVAPLLCDETTARDATGIECVERGPLILKGFAVPVPAWHPVGRRRKSPVTLRQTYGRSGELERLTALLQARATTHECQTITIVGEAGIGKSAVIKELMARAEELGFAIWFGQGEQIENRTGYHAWRSILVGSLGGNEAPDMLLARLQDVFSDAPGLIQSLPLLNAVLPLGLPHNDLTSAMTDAVRANNTLDLLVELLGRLAEGRRTMVIVDDAHWLDSASWALAARLTRSVPELTMIFAMRPGDQAAHEGYAEIVAGVPAEAALVLGPLDEKAVASLIAATVQTAAVDDDVVEWVLEVGGGHPLFSVQMIFGLRESGLLQVTADRCSVRDTAAHALEAWPRTIQGLVTSRIDRIPTREKLLVRAASVLGAEFRGPALYAMVADELTPAQFDQTLAHLLADPGSPLSRIEGERYAFRHALIVDVVYGTLVQRQRQSLHAMAADWIGTNLAEDDSRYHPLLAHHWGAAGVPDRVVYHLERSGELALATGAYPEAVRFFREASTWWPACKDYQDATTARSDDRPAPKRREAHWMRQTAEAFYGMGDLSASEESFERACALLCRPLPEGDLRRTLALMQPLAVQAIRLLVGPPSSGGSPDDLEIARALERLAQIHYLGNRTVSALHAAISTLGLAQRGGPTRELARAYSNVGLAAGSVTLHRIARKYFGCAASVAEAVGDPIAQAYVDQCTGNYEVCIGAWPEATKHLERAMATSERLGDTRRWSEGAAILAVVCYRSGEFRRGADISAKLEATLQKRDNALYRVWALTGQVQNLTPTGRHRAAAEALERTLKENPKAAGNADLTRAYGLLVKSWLALGEISRARAVASELENLSDRNTTIVHFTIDGPEALAMLYLHLWDTEGRGRWAERCRLQCNALRRLALLFPFARSIHLLFRGRYLNRLGRQLAARRTWTRGLASAQERRMPYYAALLESELALSGRGDAERLGRVLTTFERLGASLEVERTRVRLALFDG